MDKNHFTLLPADVQRYEPRAALNGGGDGLDVARRVVLAASGMLRPGGWLLIEVGGSQDEALAPRLRASGFGNIERWSSDDGELLGMAAQRKAFAERDRLTGSLVRCRRSAVGSPGGTGRHGV